MKTFNIVIAGVGGQGVITLAQLIAEAAFAEGKDVKTSETHGLSQRGGSIESHIRFGEKVYSPLTAQGEADLILSLEILETLRKLKYASKETVFLINGYSISYPGSPSDEEIGKMMEEIKNRKFIVPASRICQEKFQKDVLSGVYLLGFAVHNNLIPLKPESVLMAIENLIPKKHLETNKQAFELAKSN
ncbi:MAG: indolepyruvate oxidoreductase subunit beta [bacterium]|nr:indolepyruvate oxidoreductase subunit beta [bacterium]